ncbi:acyl carrier protein [Erysipelothrix rhusiopathiae]|uniref:acyl carrier protein n=1 Tax=Erysipelothrix rhusiopathiae TaxID=1648 RepID=UPI000F435E1C|nr:acyl carrier protein [Erysipelothrix rhusiopathiae]AYV35187.1 acyl carrier protein [Erysipelothrix rhusiopathiae]MDE8033117.1 acyl carrier protein [Erysipelothrix rhusiopathiae]MDE8037171.1 acyl carrier protein [Erysipelothrix rhusiopathiae]MDE8037586.1 acyl carrier protein [Erysipelothrix rhusiopathiae]MDE8040126.1 acyl carrier protein [Erysipelothrix rhusiopathiae]
MNKLLEILEDIKPNIDYEKENELVDKRILDSFSILTLVAELEDSFDIEIPYDEIKPNNFNSLKNMWEMVSRLSGEN